MTTWIELDGVDNLRDLGGMQTSGGDRIAPGKLWRSDNLQTLTSKDVKRLHKRGLSDVIDLRSKFEVETEGPTPLSGKPWVTKHWHSLVVDTEGQLVDTAIPLPEQAASITADPVAASYLSYISERPGGIVAAMRIVASAPGAALVHCAAGKDRTGTVIALTLSALGVPREVIVTDYAQTSERIGRVVARMRKAPSYRDQIRDIPDELFLARPEAMYEVLTIVDSLWGSVPALLTAMGWSDTDQESLASRLLE